MELLHKTAGGGGGGEGPAWVWARRLPASKGFSLDWVFIKFETAFKRK